jgi:hypothetical protein
LRELLAAAIMDIEKGITGWQYYLDNADNTDSYGAMALDTSESRHERSAYSEEKTDKIHLLSIHAHYITSVMLRCCQQTFDKVESSWNSSRSLHLLGAPAFPLFARDQ